MNQFSILISGLVIAVSMNARSLADAQDSSKSTGSSLISRPTMRIRAYVQADGQFFLQDQRDVSTSSFVLRRVRPIFEGEAGKLFSYVVMPDFGLGVTVLQDARLDLRFSPAARIRIGKFKAPVGLERLQSATDLSFVFRATPTLVVPNRDIGVQFFGETFSTRLTYALGVFNGVPDGGSADADIDDNKELAARVFGEPWKADPTFLLAGLGIGLSGTFGSQSGTILSPGLSTYKTGAGQTFFRYRADATDAGTAMANGQKYRLSPQASFYYGPLGMLLEYAVSSQEVRRGTSTCRSTVNAWEITGLLALTGEKVSFKGLQPNEDFDPESGSLGAFELAARYMQWRVNEDVFPEYADPRVSMRGIDGWSVAVHWYLSSAVKFLLNYEQILFRAAPSGLSRDPEKAVLLRLQVNV